MTARCRQPQTGQSICKICISNGHWSMGSSIHYTMIKWYGLWKYLLGEWKMPRAFHSMNGSWGVYFTLELKVEKILIRGIAARIKQAKILACDVWWNWIKHYIGNGMLCTRMGESEILVCECNCIAFSHADFIIRKIGIERMEQVLGLLKNSWWDIQGKA